jgi:hypothetical protein
VADRCEGGDSGCEAINPQAGRAVAVTSRGPVRASGALEHHRFGNIPRI